MTQQQLTAPRENNALMFLSSFLLTTRREPIG